MSNAPKAAIRDALQQTIQAGSARIVYDRETDWTLPKPAESQDKRGIRNVATHGALTVGKLIGKALLRLISPRLDFRRQTGKGVIDLSGRRLMVDYGYYAQLQINEQEWSGRSGRPLDTLFVRQVHVGSPLWLVDLLAGVTAAEEYHTVAIDNHATRHFTATIDLAEASAAAPCGMASPAQDRFETLRQLEAEVWLDDCHVRQIRFADGNQTCTLALSDFGVNIDDLDWSRLPDFESPEGSPASAGRNSQTAEL